LLTLGVFVVRRLCSLVVLSLVMTLGQASVPVAAEAALTGPASQVDDDQALVNTAGPLGGLPEPVDAADRIDALPTGEELPEGVGSAEVDGSWSEVPGIPVSVREASDGELPASVDEVEVSVSAPTSNETAVGESVDSLLVALTPAATEPSPTPTETPSTESTETPSPTGPTPSPTESTPSPTGVVPPSETVSPTETASTEAVPEATESTTPTEPAVSETPSETADPLESESGAEPVAVSGVEVRVDYSDFAQAFGGGWADRLSVSAYPACYAETPEVAECAQGVPVESGNDAVREVVKFSTTDGEPAAGESAVSQRSAFASEPAGEGAVVFAVSAEAGNYAATPVAASSSWQVGTGSGEFSYAYPFELPSVMGVATPSLGLSYSSGSVDAMTTAENGQASQAGLGWDMSTGYITRSFASCKDDGHPTKGDWCWKSRTGAVPAGVPQLVEDYRIVLAGQSSRLIRIGTSNEFRLAQDPGWRIRLLAGDESGMDNGAGNGDDNNEGFVVESPDGTSYFFGSGAGTNSVWTVPVFGNDAGEPCYDEAGVGRSWCQQAWRWSLDKSVDSLGHKVVYTYKTEDNHYALWGDPNHPVRYDRAGYLDEIFYGLKASQGRDQAHARVTVYSGPRCNVELDGVGDCLADGNTPRQAPRLWPDVPTDLICDAEGPCANGSPSFFSIHRYDRVVTQTVGDEGGLHSVDRYDLSFTMPDPDKDGDSDGPDEPDLWLNAIRRTGLGGNGEEIILPAVQFDGVVLRNKVVAPAGARKLAKFRVDSLRNETGGRVQVRYGHAEGRGCDADYVAGRDRWDSARECFAQRWAPPGADLGPDEEPPWTWFHKYVVTRVALGDDAVGYRLGDENQVEGGGASVLGGLRVYDYDYAGAPGWRFENSPLKATADESWTDWRGYERTWIHTRRTGDNETIQPGDVSLQRVIRYRGLSGNLAQPGGDQPVVRLSVADGGGEGPVDHGWLQGRTAETATYQPVDGEPVRLSRSYTTYDWFTTVDPVDDAQAKARLIWADTVSSTTDARAGGTRDLHTTVTTAVDEGGETHRGVKAGAVTKVQTTATGTQPTCVTTTWAAAAGDGWIRAPHDQITKIVPAATGDFDACEGSATARSITYYDDLDGAGITAGLPTRVVAHTGPDGDPANSTITSLMAYDSWGRLARTTDPRGGLSKVEYLPENGLTTRVVATNAKGHRSTTELDVWRGQPVESIDANDASTRMAYDSLGRLVVVRKPGNHADEAPSLEFGYSVNAGKPSRVKTTVQRAGTVTDASFGFTDGWGRSITTLTPSAGGPDRWVAAVTGYDEQGQTRFTVPSALTGQVAAVNIVLDDDAPRYTRTSYDAAARPVSSTDMYAGAPVATTRWTHRGDSTITNPPVGGDTVTTLDGLGRTLAVDQHASSATSIVLDAASYTYTPSGALATIKAAHQTGAAESTWSYSYDWLGQRQTATDPDTGTTTYDYDASGNLTKTASPGVTTLTDYDILNRPLTRRDGDGAVRASWTYDTAPAGAATGASTNLVGRAVSTTAHTAEGVFVTTADGYLADGDLKGTTATWPAPWTSPGATSGVTATASVSYDYNDASQVTTTHYAAIYNADNLGLPARDVTSEYTTGGLWAQDTTDGGATVIARADYNWHNQPIGLDSTTPTATGTRGLQRAYSWQDATGYLDTLAGRTGEATDPTTWLSLDYGYDAGGNILTIDGRAHDPATASTVQGAWCYSYDGLNRLATAKTGELSTATATTCDTNQGSASMVGSKHDLAYSYTRDGLATYTDLASGATTSYAYPATGDPQTGQPVHGVTTITQTGTDANKTMPLPSTGTIALAYDTAGRIATLTKTDANQPTNPHGTWYAYDTLGNLAQQTTGTARDTGDREVTDALYDTDGLRLLRRSTSIKNNKSATTSTFYLGEVEITLTGTNNPARTVLRTYTTPGGTPVATEENKGTGTGIAWTWLLADQQHNIRLTRDSTGIKRTNYLPSGAPTGNVNLAPGARGYLNKTHDPSGDIRLDHRNYTPGINILTTPDPLLAPYDPQSLNPYAYARNNPITLSDPTGLCVEEVCNPTSKDPDALYDGPIPAAPAASPAAEESPSESLRAPFCYMTACSTVRLPLTPDDLQVQQAESAAFSHFVMAFIFDKSACDDRTSGACGFEVGTAGPWFKVLRVADIIDDIKDLNREFDAIQDAANAANGGANAVRLGQAGENAVRGAYQIGDKTPFNVLGRDRVADGMTSTTISEVKNVRYQAYTQQLKDYVTHSIDRGLRFDLYVRGGANPTILSPQLEEAVGLGQVTLRYIP